VLLQFPDNVSKYLKKYILNFGDFIEGGLKMGGMQNIEIPCFTAPVSRMICFDSSPVSTEMTRIMLTNMDNDSF